MRQVLTSLVVLFLFSCGDAGNQAGERKVDPFAGRFQLIEGRLNGFANKHQAKISTVWSKVKLHPPGGSDSVLVKHIVWNEGRLGKAIFIQQHSGMDGIDTTAWDFSNIAWLQDTQTIAKPAFVKNLLTKVDFRIIEANIEGLLNESEKVLGVIKEEDVK